ncbi:MAG: ABC transporter ATP-binding protein [Treponema sp.]|jgi:putative ABC transport system ATP-binding protein|nr:ABC transporter ATP-binding protein [Treponema sp.]
MSGERQVPVIDMQGIRRSFRIGGRGNDSITVEALRGVNFSAFEGEFVSIMGPSGSGKSTLMNILGCLDRPSGGSYRLDGIETTQSTECGGKHSFVQKVPGLLKREGDTFAAIRNEKIGFVFQAFNLLARTTALENVELPLFYNRKIKTSRAGRRERARTVLREVGLESRMEHYPSQLSGGQQQRVAIARAMVSDPAFILADEPTGNLDSVMSLEIMALFQNLNSRGKTIVMVTHESELAVYTKRIVMLRDGLIVRDEELKERRNAAEDLKQKSEAGEKA